MENNSNEKIEISRSEDELALDDLTRLQAIAVVLNDMGFNVNEDFINLENLSKNLPFPIVRDGLDGIRVSYKGPGSLKVWFTNGFEDPNNPRRLEVEKKLREAGLLE